MKPSTSKSSQILSSNRWRRNESVVESKKFPLDQEKFRRFENWIVSNNPSLKEVLVKFSSVIAQDATDTPASSLTVETYRGQMLIVRLYRKTKRGFDIVEKYEVYPQ